MENGKEKKERKNSVNEIFGNDFRAWIPKASNEPNFHLFRSFVNEKSGSLLTAEKSNAIDACVVHCIGLIIFMPTRKGGVNISFLLEMRRRKRFHVVKFLLIVNLEGEISICKRIVTCMHL